MGRLPDAYTFQARVVPVVVVALAPIFLLGASIIVSARIGIATGLVGLVFAAVAGQIGRDRGKRLEPQMWMEWGGAPTTRLLRYRDACDLEAVDRLHERITAVLGDPLPTRAEEAADPVRSDLRYAEAVRRLIGLTHDHDRFPLVFAENVSYGMRRNLLGLRPYGIAVASVTILAAVLLLAFAHGHGDQRAARYGPGLAVAAVELVFWVVVVNKSWVKTPAEEYARQLISTVDLLRQPA